MKPSIYGHLPCPIVTLALLQTRTVPKRQPQQNHHPSSMEPKPYSHQSVSADQKGTWLAIGLPTLTPPSIKQQGHGLLFATFGIPLVDHRQPILISNPSPNPDTDEAEWSARAQIWAAGLQPEGRFPTRPPLCLGPGKEACRMSGGPQI